MSEPSYESIPLEQFQQVFKDTSTEVSSLALGGKIVSFSDEFFAEASNLLKVHPSVSMKGQFGPKGALYDGWETRRHNAPDHDWVIIKLGPQASTLIGFDIDTANFTGNEGPAADVWGLQLTGTEAERETEEKKLEGDDVRWEKLLPVVPLGPSSRHLFKIQDSGKTYSHLKLSMIPDGGFGRFRAYGIPQPPTISSRIDLAYALNGGRIVAQSDQHFGIASNLLLPGRGFDMGDGWECKRSRKEGNKEWTIVRLGCEGFIDHVEIDTAYHMGNFPMYAELHAINSSENVPPQDAEWTCILSKKKQGPHRQHFYPIETGRAQTFTHVRLTILPDGGLKRLRIMGYPASSYPQGALPLTHQPNPIPQLEALPLTYEAFLPYGKVVQAFSAPTVAPRGIAKTTNNQGTAAKYHQMAKVENNYGAQEHRTIVSTMRAEPKIKTGDSWDITVLEKHPHTTQTFVPFGHVEGKGSAPGDGSYVVTACLSDSNGQPDLSTLRSFLAMPSQGVTYGINVWHHGTLTADSTLSYAVIESIADPLPEAAIDFFKPGGTIAQIAIPKTPARPSSTKHKITAATNNGPLSSLKSMVSSLGSSGISCAPLTAENFKAYGNVIQTWPKQSEAPSGIASQLSPDGKTIKYHELAPVTDTYAKELGASTNVSVFRCTVKEGMNKGKPWPVHFMERHPHTEQAFIPMGISTWLDKGEEPIPEGAAYIVIVADNGADGRPDSSSVKAFFCTADQGVNYHTGVWHHPMLTLGGPIDFSCIETQINHRGGVYDVELLEFEEALAVVDIPDF